MDPEARPGRVEVALGAVAIVGGLVLVAEPTRDPSAVVVRVGSALVLLAVIRLVGDRARPSRRWSAASAAVGLVVGVILLVLADPTVRTAAVLVGGGLVVTGAVDLAGALLTRPDDRLVRALGAAFTLVLGLAALSWPTVTVLVLSTVVGARMTYVGVDLVVSGVRRRPRAAPGWPSVVLRSAALVAALAVLAGSVAIHRAAPEDPGPFYAAPEALPGGPGVIIRAESVDPFLDGAVAQRVLYVTTDRSGRRTTASGLVVTPDGEAPSEGRPVAAISHGTIGVARRCAPSNIDGPAYAPAIPGLQGFLDAGFVVAATDYAGLGSEGVNGYLIGLDEAASTLDAVRAAVALPGTGAREQAVVFGESQGGHAALFAGEEAPTYAPEIDLVGVAAAAPATDLASLFEANVGTTFGDILASYALVSWSRAYRAGDLGLARPLDLDEVVDPDARPAVERLAEMCLQDPAQIAALFPEAAILSTRFLTRPPWTIEPWRSVITANTPGQRHTDAPDPAAPGRRGPPGSALGAGCVRRAPVRPGRRRRPPSAPRRRPPRCRARQRRGGGGVVHGTGGRRTADVDLRLTQLADPRARRGEHRAMREEQPGVIEGGWDPRRVFEVVLGVPVTDGNEVTVLRNGDRIFPAMLDAIEEAERSDRLPHLRLLDGRHRPDASPTPWPTGPGTGCGCASCSTPSAARRWRPLIWPLMTMRGAGSSGSGPSPGRGSARSTTAPTGRCSSATSEVGFTGGVGIAAEWEGDARGPDEWRDTHFRVEGPGVDGPARRVPRRTGPRRGTRCWTRRWTPSTRSRHRAPPPSRWWPTATAPGPARRPSRST